MKFFLDDSGSTGDVARIGAGLDFGGQPVFALCAIGARDPDALGAALRGVARRRGMGTKEVKSSALIRDPGFAAELAGHLEASDCPLFVEVMDKRFLMVTNLMNHVLLPPLPGFDDASGPYSLRGVLSDVVHGSLPDAVFHAFAEACETPSRVTVDAMLAALMQWVSSCAALGGFADVLSDLVREARTEFDADAAADAHLRRLPLPDPSVTGRPVWMLPGLSAMTNVYARINMYRSGSLASVDLVHDEDMVHGCVLAEAKALMERLAAEGAVPDVPHADYALREHARLVFARSVDEPGIQAADVIGGFVMRFVRDALHFRAPDRDRCRTMDAIASLTDVPSARGLNFVMARRDMERMGIGWT